MRTILALAIAATAIGAAPASADHSSRSGSRLDAITDGRIYDPLLTPQLNPRFWFAPGVEQEARRTGRFRDDQPQPEQPRWFWQR